MPACGGEAAEDGACEKAKTDQAEVPGLAELGGIMDREDTSKERFGEAAEVAGGHHGIIGPGLQEGETGVLHGGNEGDTRDQYEIGKGCG